MKLGMSAVAASAAVLFGMNVYGAPVDVSFVNISNNGNAGLSNQLKLTVSDVAGDSTKVDFLFKNLVGISSSIKEVYFDAGSIGSVFSGGAIHSQGGANFAWGSGSPGNLPGGNSLTPAFETTINLLADSGSGGPTTGLNQAADWLTVRLTLAGGKTFNDVVNGLLANPSAAHSVRVGLHVISIGSTGGSDSYVSNLTVIPLPPAAWTGLGCLVAVIGGGLIRSRSLRARA